MQYQEIYGQGVSALEKAGIEEAALDARLLLEETCGTDRTALYAHGERELTEEQEKRYLELIGSRAERVPLQHILGRTEFMGLTFKVNEDVLCPRQDTEILVEEVLKYLHDGMRILDIGTGSGCILLSLLHYSNDCRGVGADISEKALQVARENAAGLSMAQGDIAESSFVVCGEAAESFSEVQEGSAESFPEAQEEAVESFSAAQAGSMESFPEVQEHAMENLSEAQEDVTENSLAGEVSFVRSDLFNNIEGKFEIIVSNPPYIRSGEIENLMPEVRDYDPCTALDGGEDGLIFYRRITEGAKDHLAGGGMLFYEIGYDQGEAVRRIMEENGFREVEIVKDFSGLDRVVFGTLYACGK